MKTVPAEMFATYLAISGGVGLLLVMHMFLVPLFCRLRYRVHGEAQDAGSAKVNVSRPCEQPAMADFSWLGSAAPLVEGTTVLVITPMEDRAAEAGLAPDSGQTPAHGVVLPGRFEIVHA